MFYCNEFDFVVTLMLWLIWKEQNRRSRLPGPPNMPYMWLFIATRFGTKDYKDEAQC
jgi:hypothetical protein